MTFLMYFEWIAGFVLQIFLARVMRLTGGDSRFRCFYLWIVFEFAKSPLLLALFQFGTRMEYFWAYWCFDIVNALLQVGVCYEMFAVSVGSRQRVRRHAKPVFAAILAGMVVLVASSSWTAVTGNPDPLINLAARISRSIEFSLCAAFLLTLGALRSLGVRLDRQPRAIASGLGVFIGLQLSYAAVLGVWGWSSVWLIHIPRAGYFLAMWIWITSFCSPEPKPMANHIKRSLLNRMKRLLYGDTEYLCSR